MYAGDTTSHVGVGLTAVRTTTTYAQQLRLVGRSVSGAHRNLLIVLGIHPAGNLWFAGMDLSGGLAAKAGQGPGRVIGRVAGGVIYVDAVAPESPAPLPDQTYDLEVETEEAGAFLSIRLRVDGSDWLVLPVPAGQVYDGRVGAGAWLSRIEVDEFNVGACI